MKSHTKKQSPSLSLPGSATVLSLLLVLLSASLAATAQTAPGQRTQALTPQADAANEPLAEGASASALDVTAYREATGPNGWYTLALSGKNARLAWWRDARFGCFIHWGPYSVLGGDWQGKPNPGYGEHIMRADKIPLATYKQAAADRFRPDQFDAKRWVALIKGAGMRYIVITAKHHDGFANWPSEASHYNIRDESHFARDPLQELVDAARAAGLHVGFYYSHAFDWEDPNAPGNDWDYNNPGGDRNLFGGLNWYIEHPELMPRIDRYVQGKVIPQLRELITRYHPDILWFDTPHKLPYFEQIAIIKAVRLAAPNVVINGRAAVKRASTGSIPSFNLGDYSNPNDRVQEFRPTAGDWETVPTTNESYGYDKLDPTHKPASYFIQELAKAAAKGGNTLLNIGPRGDGIIDPPDVTILEGIGKWMDVNAASIRGTERTPLDRQAWGDSTVRGGTVYLHVFRWPHDGRLVVGGLLGQVARASLLADPAHGPLHTERLNAEDLIVQVPSAAPDPVDAVVVLEMKEPIVHAAAGRLLLISGEHNQLLAFDADAQGNSFSYGDGKVNRFFVGGLERAGNSLVWSVRTDRAADFHVLAHYSTGKPDNLGEAHLVLTSGKDRLDSTTVPPTASERAIGTIDLGTLHLDAGAPHPLKLTVTGAKGVVNLFDLELSATEPAGDRR